MNVTIIKYARYVIPFFLGLKFASCILLEDNNSRYIKESRIEEIAKNKTVFEHPSSDQKYIIDFEERTVVPYSNELAEKIIKQKELEEIIGNQSFR